MSILENLPGTGEWVLARYDRRTGLKVRAQLRALARFADAQLAVLWMVERNAIHTTMEFSGERSACPDPYPDLVSTVPSYTTVVSVDGEPRDAVVHIVRVGRPVPSMGLAVIDAHVAPTPELLRAVEDVGAAVEDLLVDAIA